jgi:hypothetical protein
MCGAAEDVVVKPVLLIYDGWLPKNVGHNTHWRQRHHLKQLACACFGQLPSDYWATTLATVRAIRVLGPKQRPLDRDNLAWLMKPIIDAAVHGGYLKDDREKWADIQYFQDSERRHEGPKIEITITYQE